MAIMLYLSFLLISATPVFLYAAPPPALSPSSSSPTPPGPVELIIVTNTATEWTTVTSTSTIRSYTNYEPRERPTTDWVEKRALLVPFYVTEYPASRVSTACSYLLSSLTTTETPIPTETGILAPRQAPSTPPQPELPIPETEIVTASTTVTQTATETRTTLLTLPTLCDPQHFGSYRGSSDTREAKFKSVPLTTKENCCVGCYNEENCIFFMIGNLSGEVMCHYRIVTEEFLFSSVGRDDLCPLGVSTGSSMVHPGSMVGAEYGPCLAAAPLGEEG